MRIGYPIRNFRYWRRDIKLQILKSRTEFESATLEELGAIALHNLDVLKQILEFNRDNDLPVYEVSYDLFPWIHMVSPAEYPQIDCVASKCTEIRRLIQANEMRVCVTPTLWQSVCGKQEESLTKAKKILEGAALMLDTLGMPKSYEAPIIISLTTNRKVAREKYQRFTDFHVALPHSVKSRLVVRNDQKFTRFKSFDLTEDLQEFLEIPVVIDTLFHELNPDGSSIEEALECAFKTWGTITPLFYYSEMKTKVEWTNPKKDIKNSERSYLVYSEPPFSEKSVDCLIRAFGHEKAAIHMRNKYWRK